MSVWPTVLLIWTMTSLIIILAMSLAAPRVVSPTMSSLLTRWSSTLSFSILRGRWRRRGMSAVLFLSVYWRGWGRMRWRGLFPALILFSFTIIWGMPPVVPSAALVMPVILLSTTIVGIIIITNGKTLSCYLRLSRLRLRWSYRRRLITKLATTWQWLAWLEFFDFFKRSLGLLNLLFLSTLFIKLIFDQILGHSEWWSLGRQQMAPKLTAKWCSMLSQEP